MREFELFNRKSEKRCSRVFTLYPKTILEFTAFYFEDANILNLKSGSDCATLHRVRLEKGGTPSVGNNCGCDVKTLRKAKQPSIRDCMEIRQCGSWIITPEQNITFLSVPGDYVLCLNCDESVGNVLVVGREYNYKDLPMIPQDLFFGTYTKI